MGRGRSLRVEQGLLEALREGCRRPRGPSSGATVRALERLSQEVAGGECASVRCVWSYIGAPTRQYQPADPEPLVHVAIRENQPQALKTLLVLGADPESRVRADIRAVHHVSIHGLYEPASILLVHGADPNAPAGSAASCGGARPSQMRGSAACVERRSGARR